MPTTITPANGAELITACNTTAVSGDTIILTAANSPFATGATALAPVAGVTIAGEGKASVAITGQFNTDLGALDIPLTMSGFTVDTSGLDSVGGYGTNTFRDGTYNFTNVDFTGNKSGVSNPNAQVTFDAADTAVVATMTDCVVDEGKLDGISTKAPGGAGVAAASLLTLYNCEVSDCGSDVNDQLLTAHQGFAIIDHNGNYHSPNSSKLITPDAFSTSIDLYGTIVNGGIVKCRDAINLIGTGASLEMAGNAIDCRLIGGIAGSHCIVSDTANARIEGNRIVKNLGAGGELYGIVFSGDNTIVNANIITGVGAVNSVGVNWTKGETTVTITNNYVHGAERAYRLDTPDSGVATVLFANNIAVASIDFDILDNTGAGTLTWLAGGGYNILTGEGNQGDGQTANTGVYPDFATDVWDAPELDANYWPIPGGNCDIGKGSAGARPLGTRDHLGRPTLSAEDVIGAIYPQRRNRRNILKPTMQYAVEMR